MAAPKGNNNKTKYKTKESRAKLLEQICEHLSQGYNQDTFPYCDWDTVEKYTKEFPVDFPAQKLSEAKKKGFNKLEQLGFDGAQGKIPGFNATAWIFLTKNKMGWKDKTDITSDDKQMTFVVTRSSDDKS